LRASVLCFAAISLCATLFGAQNDEFYDSAFRAGVAAFESGRYDEALTRLHAAAFGFVEDVGRYETAQAYMAVAAQRLGRTDEATAALRRIVAAERIERRFAAIPVSSAVRTAVADAAKTLLTPQLAAFLLNPPPQPQIAAPTPTPPPNSETIAAPDPAALLAAANHALDAGDLPKARAAFEKAALIPDLPHVTLLKAAEGLTRARDFQPAVAAFERAGAFAKGEETYRYFYAVALYESGRYRDAKRELAAALPFIKQTADVKRYKTKITNAHE
jgi:tetratricopeptide (TPR) repeat protein